MNTRRLLARSLPRSITPGTSRAAAVRRPFTSGSGGSRNGTKSGRYIPLALAMALGASMMTPLAADDSRTRPSPAASAGAPSTSPVTPPPSIQVESTLSLARSYFVYTLCSIPLLIDHAPGLLHTLTHTPIPGLKPVVEAVVRRTFFAQFVAGESAEECAGKMTDLRSRGVGAILNYSAEAEVLEAGDVVRLQRERLEEVERALDALGKYERDIAEKGGMKGSTSFAVKITGLIDPDILHRASTTLLRLRPLTTSNSPSSPLAQALPPVPYPGAPMDTDAQVVARSTDSLANERILALTSLKGELGSMGVLATDEGLRDGDLKQLADLWGKLKSLGNRARDNGVKLLIDAEHTWYQPALDAYTLLLSEEFNRPPKSPSTEWTGPLIYGTYQSYLTRQPALLLTAIRHAEKNGYALGVKLVRGAYFVQEREKWKTEGREGPDPIWPDKPATDLAFNSSVSTIISNMATQLSGPHPRLALNVFFGTHNGDSVSRIIDELKTHGLAKEVEGNKLRLRDDVLGKVFIAQLYGMKDDLMDQIVEKFEPSPMPISLKYIAYGKLDEVMPFLGRRAIENKSLMSGDAGAAAERQRIWNEIRRRFF